MCTCRGLSSPHFLAPYDDSAPRLQVPGKPGSLAIPHSPAGTESRDRMFQRPIGLVLRSVSRLVGRRLQSSEPAEMRSSDRLLVNEFTGHSSIASNVDISGTGDIVRSSSRSSSRVSDQRLGDLLTTMDNQVRRIGRIQLRDVSQVLRLMRSGSPLTAADSATILRCCGSVLRAETLEKRNKLCDEVWDTLKKNRTGLAVSHYNALIQVYNENNRSYDPLDILQQLQDAGLEPNRVTYNRIIHSYCMKGDIAAATKVLQVMKEKDMLLTEPLFQSLILGYGVAGDMESVKSTFATMVNADIDPSPSTYTVVLCALAKNAASNEKDFIRILDRSEDEGVFLRDRQKLDIVRSLLLNGAGDLLTNRLLNSMEKRPGYQADALTVTSDLLNAGKVDEAIRVFESIIPGMTAERTKSHGMTFIKQLVTCGQVPDERVFAFCQEMKDRDLNHYGYMTAVGHALRLRDRQKSRLYLKKLREETADQVLRPHWYWPLLSQSTNEEEVIEVLVQDMMPAATTGDSDELSQTLEFYVWPKVKDAIRVLETLKAAGYSYTALLTSLTRHHVRSENGVLSVPRIRPPQRLEPPVPQGTGIKRVIQSGDLTKALAIRASEVASGRSLSLSDECSLIENLLSQKSIRPAFDIVMQMSVKKKFPTPRVLRLLTEELAKAGLVEEIEELRISLPPEFTGQASFSAWVVDAYTNSRRTDELATRMESLRPFPLGPMQGLIEKKPELVPQMSALAEKLAASEQYFLPLNMMWIYWMKIGEFDKADAIIQSALPLRNTLMFIAVMNAVREKEDLALADKLIETLLKTNLSPRSIGVAVSAKVDALLDKEQVGEAEKLVHDVSTITSGRVHSETGDAIDPTSISDVNRNTLIRLNHQIFEKSGRQLVFPVPERVQRNGGNGGKGSNGTSDSSDSSGGSDSRVSEAQ